ncbi:MAG: N-acyl homoserine lactonase family protein [Verrucomicrobia bacterium]|nr:N-acyl homoserine lactonase family protein [Verrucomicrobiota bacterium]
MPTNSRKSLPVTYRLKAFRSGLIPFPVPAPLLFWQAKLDQKVNVANYFWLLTGQGRNVLVDTGLGAPRFKEDYQTVDAFRIERGEDTLSHLEKQGLHADDIDQVILTHLHLDHCLNLPLFPRAEIILSHRAWETMCSPPHPALIPPSLYPRKIFAHLKRHRNRVRLIGDDEDVLPGIRCFWVGGHSPCSQCVAVRTGKGKTLIAGDILFYWANLEENIPVGYFTSLVEWYRALDRIRGENYDLILPAHDPELGTRYPNGEIA